MIAVCFMQLLSLGDFVTDIAVYTDIVIYPYGELPCQFGGLGNKVSCDVAEGGFDVRQDFSNICGCDDFSTLEKHYDAVCHFDDLFSVQSSFESSCVLRAENHGCNCRNFNSYDEFENALDFIYDFVYVALIVLLVKEGVKVTLLALSSFFSTLRKPKYFKFVLNSPVTLLLMIIPSFRVLVVETHVGMDEIKRLPSNILFDLFLEDLPGLMVPCFYMYFAEPTTLQLFSLYITSFSIMLQCYHLVDRLFHRCHARPKAKTDGTAVEVEFKQVPNVSVYQSAYKHSSCNITW
jgi:hypothetical protein